MYVYVAPTQYASALNFSLCLPFHAHVNQSIRSPCPRSMEKRRVFSAPPRCGFLSLPSSPPRLPRSSGLFPSAPPLPPRDSSFEQRLAPRDPPPLCLAGAAMPRSPSEEGLCRRGIRPRGRPERVPSVRPDGLRY